VANQKMGKSLPKRAGRDHKSHARRQVSYERGKLRKAERIAEQTAREAANRAAGKVPKARKRKRDNMKFCDLCVIGGPRLIVCGQVCICTKIGASREAVKAR